MSKLKVDEIRQSTRSVSDSANITLANDGSTTIPNGTLSAGTIGDNVTMSNKYYRTAKLNATTTLTGGVINFINTTTTTNPYFVAGDGDTTNIEYHSTNSNIRLLRAGVYIITFQGTFLENNQDAARAVAVNIYVASSVNTTNMVSNSLDQIASTQNDDDYANACAFWVGHCNANTYVRFGVRSYNNNDSYISDNTRYCIALIRPT